MSQKPVAERLQVKSGRTLAVIGSPKPLDAAIGAADARAPAAKADVLLLFVKDRAAWKKQLPGVLKSLGDSAIFWLAYPKLTSPLAGDLDRDVIRELAPAYGLDTVAQIAIDSDWSALRLKRVD